MSETASAAAPAAPQAAPEITSAADFLNQTEDTLAAKYMAETAPSPEAAQSDAEAASAPRRGPDGKFVADAPAEDDAEAPGSPAEASADAEEATDGEEAAEAVDAAPDAAEVPKDAKPAREPMTPFSVADAEGEVEAPIDLQITYKANGKELTRPLDHVVKMAQMGEYNAEREAKVTQSEQAVQQYAAKVQQYEQERQQIDATLREFYANPDKYLAARDAFQQQHTPEAQLARAQAELNEIRQGEARRGEDQQLQSFASNVLVPHVTSLLAKNTLVPEAELVGKYTMLTAPYLQNGRVPVQYLPHVQALVERDLTHWAESTHMARLADQQQAESAKKATARIALEKEQQAKTKAARVGKPVGQAPSAARTSAPAPKPASAGDWFNQNFAMPSND